MMFGGVSNSSGFNVKVERLFSFSKEYFGNAVSIS